METLTVLETRIDLIPAQFGSEFFVGLILVPSCQNQLKTELSRDRRLEKSGEVELGRGGTRVLAKAGLRAVIKPGMNPGRLNPDGTLPINGSNGSCNSDSRERSPQIA